MINLIKRPWLGLAFIFIVCLLFLFSEAINHRLWLSDFEVYYKTAIRLINSQNLYRFPEDGFYIFKYSPVSALLFLPFTVFSFEVAKIIYWLFLSGIIVMTFYISLTLLTNKSGGIKNTKQTTILYILTAVVVAMHFLRELHLGQVNYLLMFIYVLVAAFFIRKNETVASILLSLSIFIKPFGLIFIPYLIFKKKYKALIIFGSGIIVWGLTPLIFYRNWGLFVNQYYAWFNEIAIEMGHKQNLLGDANHTIFSVIARFTPLRFLLGNSAYAPYFQIVILLLITWFLYKVFQLTNKIKNYESVTLDFYLIIGLIPLLSFTSDNAFVFEQLLVMAVIYNFKLLSSFEKSIAVTSFLFIGGNFAELIGRQVSTFLDNNSFVSIGAILLIFVYYKLLIKLKNHQSINSSDGLID